MPAAVVEAVNDTVLACESFNRYGSVRLNQPEILFIHVLKSSLWFKVSVRYFFERYRFIVHFGTAIVVEPGRSNG